MCHNSFYHSLVIRHLGYFIMLHNDILAYKCLPKFLITRKVAYQIGTPWVCLLTQRKKPLKG